MPSCDLIPLYKALAPRKGDAASVRRQSRQRLRSERRYRRNWCAPFSRWPVRIVCAAPGEACLAPTMAGVGRQCLPEIATAPAEPRNDKSGSLSLNVQKAPRVRRSDCRKSLAEFAPAGAKKMEIIFSGGVYVGENTARLANVRRARPSCAAASRSPFQTRAQ